MDLQHSTIWMAGVYLMLLMQFLENKVAVELTRSEFIEAQEVGGMPQILPCSAFAFVSLHFRNRILPLSPCLM